MKPRSIAPPLARTRPLGTLERKVARDQLATPIAAGASTREFLEALPHTLAAKDLFELAGAIARARRNRRSVLLMMGAHPLKVGLGPLICSLIRDGTLGAIATNGAAIIHDFELAFAGRT